MPNENSPAFPPQQQYPPGSEKDMNPQPVSEDPTHIGTGKLLNKVAIITGGDSGIGKAVCIAFAKEGADIALVYLSEDSDAKETEAEIMRQGRKVLLLKGDIGDVNFCEEIAGKVKNHFGRIDILVNNAAEQHPKEKLEDIEPEQLEKTFRTNIFSMFYLTKAVLPSLSSGSSIVNTTSVTAYRGSKELLDYSSTKGAIVSFTRSLALNLADRNIRVNAVAPGPIWTPLIASTFPEEKIEKFGTTVPLKRAGQPEEIAPAFLFLASNDSSYMTGQVLHPNGGEIING